MRPIFSGNQLLEAAPTVDHYVLLAWVFEEPFKSALNALQTNPAPSVVPYSPVFVALRTTLLDAALERNHHRRSLATRGQTLPLDHPEDVLGVHDPVLLSVELDLGSRILAKDHHVPDAHPDVLVCAHRDDLSALGLLLGRVGEYDPGLRRLLALDGPDHHPRSQRLELHLPTSSSYDSNEPRKCTVSAAIYQQPSLPLIAAGGAV